MNTMNRLTLAVLLLASTMGLCAGTKKIFYGSKMQNTSKGFKNTFMGFESQRARSVEAVNRKGKALETARVEYQNAVKTAEAKKAVVTDPKVMQAEEKKVTEGARKVAKLEAEVKEAAEDAEKDLRAEYMKLNEELFTDLLETISVWAKDNNVDEVVDAESGRVLYCRNDLDATTEIVNAFDKKHEQKLAKAKAPAPATQLAANPAPAKTA